MSVLCVGNFYRPHGEGGYEVVFQAGVRRLRAEGHDVRVLTSDAVGPAPPGAPEEDPDVHRELRLYWRDHAFLPRLPVRGRLAVERHNAAAFDRHLRETGAEAVAFWGMGALSLGLLERARRSGARVVAVVCDDWPVYGPDADQWTRLGRRLGPLRPLVERRTGLPMGPARDGVRWLYASDALRRRGAPGEVAHPGVEPAFLTPVRARDWSGKLLSVSRIDPRKGIDAAVRAVAALGPDATLTVDGHGALGEREALRRLAAELGARVAFPEPSPREALRQVYDDHDAVLFCVRWPEPWGLVPLEAMARGRPVVASGRGGSGEYLRDGENCLIADPERPQEIAQAVRRLAADPALRAHLVEHGLATARRHTAEAFERRVVAAVEGKAP